MCQETSPESSEGPIPPSPAPMSPLLPNPVDPQDLDPESQPPIIHDIVTSSPSDNEHLGATPFVTSIDLGVPLDIPASELLPAEPEETCSAPPLNTITIGQALDTPADIELIPAGPAEEGPVFSVEAEVNIPTETLRPIDPPSHADADISSTPEDAEQTSRYPESLGAESLVDDSPTPQTVTSVEEEDEAAAENEEIEQAETVIPDERGPEEEEEEEGIARLSNFFYLRGETLTKLIPHIFIV